MNNFLYLSEGKGNFPKDVTGIMPTHAVDTSAGTAWTDYDWDGDLDLYEANWGAENEINRFYQNTTTGKNFISLRLVGKTSNHFEIKAKSRISVSKNNMEPRSIEEVFGHRLC